MFISLGCASGNKPGLGAMETAYIPHNHNCILYWTCEQMQRRMSTISV